MQDKQKIGKVAIKEQYVGMRECGLMTTTGSQGTGKTFQNMNVIVNYVKDKLKQKVKGRKCLIFDTNGEFTADAFAKNGHANFHVRKIAVAKIEAWCRDPEVGAECRRVDAKSLSIKEKKAILEYMIGKVRNIMFVIEDINTYILSVTHFEEVVGKIVSLRHSAVDVLISFQSLRAVEPRIWQNSRWCRIHRSSDNVDEIKNKATNYELFKIAQIMINLRYQNGDKRFFVYITEFGQKIEGAFKKPEFENACRKYFALNKKLIKEQASINDVSEEEATAQLVGQFVSDYYDNKDK